MTPSSLDRDAAIGMPDTIVGIDGVEQPARKPCSVVTKTAAEAAKCCRHLAQLDSEHLPNRDLDVRGLAKIARKVESDKRDEELLAQYDPQRYDGTNDTNTVKVCDIHDLALEPESVDMIFCDAPYDLDAVPLYGHLAILAKHVLKPGAMCIAYVGNWHLPKTMALLAEHLEYVWTYAEFHPQSEQRVWEKNILGKHRLLLGFKKPGETERCRFVQDALWAPKEKQHHEWQQAEAAPRIYIPAYTRPGDVLLDPFCGGGTTPAVCKALGRRYLAFDKDEHAVAKTLARLEMVEFESFGNNSEPEDPDDDPDGGGPSPSPWDDPNGGGPSPSSDDDANDAASVSCNAVEPVVGAQAPTTGAITPAVPSVRTSPPSSSG